MERSKLNCPNPMWLALFLFTKANEIEVSYSISGDVITIYTDLSDDYAPPDPASPDNIDGTLRQVSTIRPPSTGTLTDTWGTVTQNSPSWTQT